MTAIADRDGSRQLWGTMPGWGIVADLTPDELVESRQLNVLRKLVAVGLGIVVVLCIAGYAWAYVKNSSASDDLDAANAQTTQLTIQQGKYSGVTRLENATDQIDTQVSTLMADDVDIAKLLTSLRASLPATMALTSISVANTGSSGTAGASSSGSLDTSGRPQIGTVTLSGSAQSVTDLATYVTTLSKLKGIVNVIPTSNNAASSRSTTWTITLQLTDLLYTHKYDKAATPTGGVK